MAAAGTGRRTLNLSGLDKCDLDMTAADFRSWRRSVEDWSLLNMVKDADAVRYIRLLCVPSLQKALNARYTKADRISKMSVTSLYPGCAVVRGLQ